MKLEAVVTKIAQPVVLLLAVFCSGFVVAQDDEAIGTIVMTRGDVVAITDAGATRVLRRRSAIYTEETIVTGETGFAQIRLVDSAIVALKENTEFKFNDYVFDGEGGDQDRAIMSLVQGGFRTIDGLISDDEDGEYRVETQYASIGVRGTAFGAFIDPDADALFTGVYEGGITVENGQGAIDLGLGGNFDFSRTDAGQAPRGLRQIPVQLGNVTVAQNPNVDNEEESEEDDGNALIAQNDDGDNNPPGDNDQAGDSDQGDGDVEEAIAQISEQIAANPAVGSNSNGNGGNSGNAPGLVVALAATATDASDDAGTDTEGNSSTNVDVQINPANSARSATAIANSSNSSSSSNNGNGNSNNGNGNGNTDNGNGNSNNGNGNTDNGNSNNGNGNSGNGNSNNGNGNGNTDNGNGNSNNGNGNTDNGNGNSNNGNGNSGNGNSNNGNGNGNTDNGNGNSNNGNGNTDNGNGNSNNGNGNTDNGNGNSNNGNGNSDNGNGNSDNGNGNSNNGNGNSDNGNGNTDNGNGNTDNGNGNTDNGNGNSDNGNGNSDNGNGNSNNGNGNSDNGNGNTDNGNGNSSNGNGNTDNGNGNSNNGNSNNGNSNNGNSNNGNGNGNSNNGNGNNNAGLTDQECEADPECTLDEDTADNGNGNGNGGGNNNNGGGNGNGNGNGNNLEQSAEGVVRQLISMVSGSAGGQVSVAEVAGQTVLYTAVASTEEGGVESAGRVGDLTVDWGYWSLPGLLTGSQQVSSEDFQRVYLAVVDPANMDDLKSVSGNWSYTSVANQFTGAGTAGTLTGLDVGFDVDLNSGAVTNGNFNATVGYGAEQWSMNFTGSVEGATATMGNFTNDVVISPAGMTGGIEGSLGGVFTGAGDTNGFVTGFSLSNGSSGLGGLGLLEGTPK